MAYLMLRVVSMLWINSLESWGEPLEITLDQNGLCRGDRLDYLYSFFSKTLFRGLAIIQYPQMSSLCPSLRGHLSEDFTVKRQNSERNSFCRSIGVNTGR